MFIFKSIKQILGLSILASSVFIDFPAQATNWLNIDRHESFEYYIDIDRANISGNIWNVPLKITSSGQNFALGELSINCQANTIKMELNGQTSNWQSWDSASNRFSHQVCLTVFPNTYPKSQPTHNQRPIINNSINGSVVMGSECSYVSAGGYTFKSCN